MTVEQTESSDSLVTKINDVCKIIAKEMIIIRSIISKKNRDYFKVNSLKKTGLSYFPENVRHILYSILYTF